MSNLLYTSPGDNQITRLQMADLPLPQAMGRFHQPYAFSDYVEEIHHSLDREGLVATTQEYVTSHDNQRMFGAMTITPKALEGELITAEDWELILGVRGSHDQSVQRGITLGSRVMVCSNLCFDGNLGTFNSKQTTNIAARIPHLVRSAISRVPQMAHKLEGSYEAYRNTVLKPRHGDAALVELHRRGALAAPQLGRAIAEWDRPSHVEHAAQGHSVWRLMNAATEALKPVGTASVNMNLVQERSQKVSAFLNEIVGI